MAHYDCSCCGESMGISHDRCAKCQSGECSRPTMIKVQMKERGMSIDIEKISNGYIVSIEGRKIFCDVPEAICGVTSEWVLAQVKRLDSAGAGDGGQAGSNGR